MDPKELTPEEIIKGLSDGRVHCCFDCKGNSIETFGTPKLSGYSKKFSKDKYFCYGIIFKISKDKLKRHTFASFGNHFTRIYKKLIKKRIDIEVTKKFGIRVANDGFDIDTIMVDLPSGEIIHLGLVDPLGFDFLRDDNIFNRSKELAIDLLKIYLDAHRDCCTW